MKTFRQKRLELLYTNVGSSAVDLLVSLLVVGLLVGWLVAKSVIATSKVCVD